MSSELDVRAADGKYEPQLQIDCGSTGVLSTAYGSGCVFSGLEEGTIQQWEYPSGQMVGVYEGQVACCMWVLSVTQC